MGPSQFRQASDPTSALEFLHWRKFCFLQDRRSGRLLLNKTTLLQYVFFGMFCNFSSFLLNHNEMYRRKYDSRRVLYNCTVYIVLLYIDLVPVTVLWAFSVFTYMQRIWQMLERQIHNSVVPSSCFFWFYTYSSSLCWPMWYTVCVN